MLKNKKGFVLIETIIVMSVITISMIILYSSYNKIVTNTGKITYYDNVQDIYTAYYAYKLNNKLGYNGTTTEIITEENAYYNVLNNLNINKIYYINKNDVDNKIVKENKPFILNYDGTTINYLNSIKNNIAECTSDPCLTIVKIKRNEKYYFAKYEAYTN